MALEQAGVQFVAAGGDVYITTVTNATKVTNTFVSATEQGGGRVSGAGQVMIGALRQIGTVAVDAFMQAAKATAGFLVDSVKVAGDFESNFNRFRIAAGKSVDTAGLSQFKDLFIQLGRELPVSTNEVEQAATEMVSGGIDPAIVAGGALRQTLNFAAASGLSLADAAQTSAKFLAGWTSSAATTAEKVAFLTESTDALTKAGAASSTTAAELRLGLFNVQGAAQALHEPFDDVVATLGLLAPAFESSAQAGTSLNVFMTRLEPQTKPARAAMEELGIITKNNQNLFFSSTGAFLGMGNAAEVLRAHMSGLSDEQKISKLHTLFGNDAMKVGNLLMQDGAAGLDAFKAKMAEQSGVQDAAAIAQQGYAVALKNAQGSVEALQITIGTTFLPLLADLLNTYIAPGINTVASFAESFFKMVPAIEASSDPLQTFLLAIAVAAPGLTDIAFQLIHAKDSFLAFATPIAAVVVPAAQQLATFVGNNLQPILFGLATAITVAVVPALVTATAAFLSAAAPIAALVAAGALLYAAWTNDFGGMRTTITAVWTTTLLPAFQDMRTWLAVTLPPAIQTLSTFWTSTLVPALSAAWTFLQTKVFPTLKDLKDIYIAAAIIEVKALAAVWTEVLQPALSAVWSFLTSTVYPIFKALFDVEFAIAGKAVEALAGLWQKVLWPAIKSVGDYISTTAGPTFKAIGDYMNSTFGPTLTSVAKWLDTVTGGFNGVTGGVKDVITWLENLASSISNLKLPPWLTPGSPTPWEIALYGIGKALSTSVAPGMQDMQQGMQDIGTTITDTFQNSSIADTLKQLGLDAMAGFGAGLRGGIQGVKNIITSTATTVEGAFQDAFQSHSPSVRMMPAGAYVIQGIAVGMQSELPSLMGVLDATAATMIAALTKHIEEGTKQINAQFDALTASVKGIASQLNGVIADAFGSTASIDRQVAANLDKLKNVLPEYLSYTTGALKEAQSQAEGFLDPAQGAKYFQMRSNQILEYAKLQKDLSEAATQDDRQRIEAQMELINKAQTAEISQLNASQGSQQSPIDALRDQLQAILANTNLPGILESPTIAQLNDLLTQMSSVANVRSDAYANPPPSPVQIGSAGGQQTSYSQQTNYNMPVYTNNTPDALQQSMAIMQASAP